MSEPVSGLLIVKPDNASHITEGSIHNLVIEKRTSGAGKEWTKLKRDRDNGSPHRILSARQTDWVDPRHGNISFSLLVEPVEGNITPATNGGGGEVRDENIARSVAFKGAVEIVSARAERGEIQPEQITGAVATLTTALLPVVKGESAEATVPPPVPAADPVGSAVDPDIPPF